MTSTPHASHFRQTLVAAAAFVVVVAGMRAASAIMVPFLLAVFIAVIITPLFIALQRKGLPSFLVLIVFILALAAIGFISVGVIGKSLQSFSNNLPSYQASLMEQMEALLIWGEEQGIKYDHEVIMEKLNLKAAMGYIGKTAGTISSLLGNAFLIFLVVSFILLEAAGFPKKIRNLPGIDQATLQQWEETAANVRRYIALKSALSALTAVLVYFMLLFSGSDFAILWGLLAFFLNFVPNIGSVIAAIPALALALVQFGPGRAGIIALGYLLINVVIGNILEPRLVGRGLGLSPLVILLSLLFWGWVLGPVGMLLSVPLTMVAKIILQNDPSTRNIALLMGPSPRV